MDYTEFKQQYQSFPLPWFGLTGWLSGTSKPVLGHKKYEIVSLVVNELIKRLAYTHADTHSSWCVIVQPKYEAVMIDLLIPQLSK